jgi:hypothetical protein
MAFEWPGQSLAALRNVEKARLFALCSPPEVAKALSCA